MTGRTLRRIGSITGNPAWLNRPLVTRVMAALDTHEARPAALFVGGCVRDSLLAKPRDTGDVDVATVHAPRHVLNLLERSGVRTIAPGLAHGTVTALPDSKQSGSVEITTLRRDVRTFGRRAEVAYSDDWVSDAERRDFTFNALYAGTDRTVYGLNDLGLRDLAKGRVRFIGTAAHRIHEDYLRILRYFRMFAWFGGRRHERTNLNAIAKALPGLDHVSGERLRVEMLRTLEAADPVPAVHAMAVTGTLHRVLGEWSHPTSVTARKRLEVLARLVRLESRLGHASPVRRLSTLVDTPRGTERAADRLCLSNAEARRLQAAATAGPPPTTCTEARRQIWEANSRERALDRLLVGTARARAPDESVAIRLGRFIPTWTPPEFPLGGEDVIALGVPPGPRRRALLRSVETWWADGGFKGTRETCLAELRRRAN